MLTDSQILHLFYAYYCVGFIIITPMILLDAFGRYIMAKKHPELYKNIPRAHSLLKAWITQIITWPFVVSILLEFAPKIIKNAIKAVEEYKKK